MSDPIRLPVLSLLASFFAVFLAGPAQAQQPTAVTSIVNSSADTTMEVNHNGSLLMPGTFGPTSPNDSIPATGAGTRLMWYPAKAAFRAGRVGNFEDGTQWDPSKVGKYSVAFGSDTKANGFAATATGLSTIASGVVATAMGDNTAASGADATAMGANTSASGEAATAMGNNTTASAFTATAMGFKTTASGKRATAMGYLTKAASWQSLSLGQCNSANGSEDGTRLVVGNGAFSSGSCDSRSDALRLKKNGDLAVGHSSPAARLHAKDKVSGSAAPSNHVGFVENTGGSGSDGLAIQSGPASTPGNAANYLTFYDGDGDPIGAIQGNGSGGITQTSGSGDFAEELPVAKGAEAPEPAEIVGVKGGTISLATENANRVMIASRAPILTGNATPAIEADDARRVAVAFVGQVPVKLRGTAKPGDLIVPSGKDDGTARAVSPEEYQREKHGPIAGQAWSAKSTEGIGEVTVAVGLGRSGAVAEQLQKQRAQIDSLEQRVRSLQKVKQNQRRLARQVAALRADRSSSLPAGWGLGALLALLVGAGGFGLGVLWRRRA